MKLLVIDTASHLEIVVAGTGDTEAVTGEPVASSHSATLLRSIDACLGAAGIAPGDLDGLAVGVGPGSFTGIRIAVSTARMFAQVLGKPLAGIPSPLVHAVSVDAAPGEGVLVAFDAKKGRVFGALYRRGDGPLSMEPVVPPGDHPIARLLDAADRRGRTHLVGDGVERYRGDAEALPGGIFTGTLPPRGDRIYALARNTLSGGGSGDYERIVPLYARKSDAEAAREGRK